MTNIQYLRNQIFQLFQVLEDPHPEIPTWVEIYEEFISNLCEFQKDPDLWRQKEEELKRNKEKLEELNKEMINKYLNRPIFIYHFFV